MICWLKTVRWLRISEYAENARVLRWIVTFFSEYDFPGDDLNLIRVRSNGAEGEMRTHGLQTL